MTTESDEKQRSGKLSTRTVLALVFLCVAVFFIVYNPSKKEDRIIEKEYVTLQGLVFGTIYHITYSQPGDDSMQPVVDAATAAVNDALSMFNPETTISKVNAASTQFETDDALFLKVLRVGRDVSAATGGAFDMTVAPLVDLWGFGLKNRQQVSAAQIDSVMKYIGYEKIIEHDGVIEKLHPSVRLDASAIAKGYACDVVLDSLLAHGCTDACVEIGGEVAVAGTNPKGKPWRIGINKPVDDSLSVQSEVYRVASLVGKGMATSGNYRNYYELDGKKFSHTINPHSGRPVMHNLLSATVVAPDCMTADAWATACMVVGLDSARVLVQLQPQLDAFFIYDSAGVMCTWSTASFPIQK